jgi:uracil-DNA glycosylase
MENNILELQTDWKDDATFMEIIRKHNNHISKNINMEIEKFEGSLDIYPPTNMIFNAFNHCNINETKVVIIGQDVYINENEANGLCFSVNSGIKCPPSLRNIFKELEKEYNISRKNTDLTDWAQQGVLLLNRALTVRQGKSMSHMKIWNQFTEDIIKFVTTTNNNIVYILWGAKAQEIEKYIDIENNLVLKWTHPSPLSRKPFVGNNHFKLCNEYLTSKNKIPISWIE